LLPLPTTNGQVLQLKTTSKPLGPAADSRVIIVPSTLAMAASASGAFAPMANSGCGSLTGKPALVKKAAVKIATALSKAKED
jgi:Zn-dependent alcohol dehydrogenase